MYKYKKVSYQMNEDKITSINEVKVTNKIPGEV